MRHIYLSGPMTGFPDNNHPAFHAEAARLRALGYTVENPAENDAPPCGTWFGWMRLALAQLIRCDTVAMLEGYAESRGARIEVCLGEDIGLNTIMACEITAECVGTTRDIHDNRTTRPKPEKAAP